LYLRLLVLPFQSLFPLVLLSFFLSCRWP
jgi:hypothetical protein